ncbi:MAG: A/G-specific adenine glycosylase [Chitinophagaceae bacterium]|nr:A/G-specific adenine glycosylase [Chitinophagaceae bacterium]
MNIFFRKKLLEWNKNSNKRDMPWKGEKDPYKIWLSEIILQQTRVEQGWNYYLKFIEHFSTITQLAKAPETKVFKLWEGLGYYSRCRNLIATAKIIDTGYGGKFPTDYDNILALKGIGPYTAAAIASFAFNLPYAVVDGNVQRIIARFFGIDIPADTTKGKQVFNQLAFDLLDKKNPGLYNQAIMDFGATVCKPQAPLCNECPLAGKCIALKEKKVGLLPVKEKKILKKNRWFYYLVLHFGGKLYVRQRLEKDIWQHLHEFYLLESNKPLTIEALKKTAALKFIFGQKQSVILSVSKEYKQQLTHQTLHGMFIEVQLSKPPVLGAAFKAVTYRTLEHLAFPKFIITYLREKNVNLSQ